jgi:hypothetical protein
MQTPEEFNQAYSAGYERATAEAYERDFVDVFRDEVTEPKSVPLKDQRGHVIGRVQVDRKTGAIYGTINDPQVADLLADQFGAGLRSISFDSLHYYPEEVMQNIHKEKQDG